MAATFSYLSGSSASFEIRRTFKVWAATSVLSCPLIAGKFSPIAEPDPDHLLLHVEAVRHKLDLLAGRLRVLVESALQSDPHRRFDRRSLLSSPTDGVRRVETVAVDVWVAPHVCSCVLGGDNLGGKEKCQDIPTSKSLKKSHQQLMRE